MKHPLPRRKKTADPFWTAAAQGRLSVPHCAACPGFHWPPRDACPACGGELLWRDAEGSGTIEAFSIVRRAVIPELKQDVPYCVGMVRLAEGVRLFTTIIAEDMEKVAAGAAVTAVFRTTDDPEIGIPVFELVREGGTS